MPAEATVDSHWDLMFEQTGYLFTLRLDCLPVWDNTVEDAAHPGKGGEGRSFTTSTRGFTLAARRLPNHRKKYLNYEGPISGNRGHVSRVSAGTFQRLPWDGSAVPSPRAAAAPIVLADGARIELSAGNRPIADLDIPMSEENQDISVRLFRWEIAQV